MNLVQLKYFQAICKYQSISAAAEALYISQPTISSAIKELEKEFGVILFRRHHHGMILTDEGSEFLRHTESILSRIDRMERAMNDLTKQRKVLRLGIPPMICSLFLPQIFNEFPRENPDIRLDITEGGRQEMLELLSKELLDMAFLSHNMPFDASLQTFQVARFETVCCVSKNSPYASLKSVSPKDIENAPVVLFKNSFFQTEEIKKWFSDSLVEPDILLQTSQLSTLQNLIKKDLAIGFMFRELVLDDEDIVPIHMEAPLHMSISLVWKRTSPFFNAMERFYDYMKGTVL